MILQHILLMIRCISALKWVHFTRESCSLFTTWHNEGKKLLAKNFGREIMQVNIKKIELYFLVMLLVMLFNEASFHLSFGSDGKFSWVFARMKTYFFSLLSAATKRKKINFYAAALEMYSPTLQNSLVHSFTGIITNKSFERKLKEWSLIKRVQMLISSEGFWMKEEEETNLFENFCVMSFFYVKKRNLMMTANKIKLMISQLNYLCRWDKLSTRRNSTTILKLSMRANKYFFLFFFFVWHYFQW